MVLSLLISWLVFSFGSVFGYTQNDVTCGSTIKLVNTDYNTRLHSHDIRYGSGSGQQSVTGVSHLTDSDSLWQIVERNGSPSCIRGRSVKCGQKIRLMHVVTRKNLHSHHFQSPLADCYEVSAFGEDGVGDEGDDWQVVCEGSTWRRGTKMRLKHISTEGYLSVSGRRYNKPIAGQHEVCVIPQASSSTYWTAADGIYVHPQDSTGQQQSTSDGDHDEL